MTAPMSATNDVLTAPIEKGTDVLAELEALVPDVKPEEEAPTLEGFDLVESLQPALDSAVTAGNKDEIKRISQQGRDAMRAQRAKMLQALEAVTDPAIRQAQEKELKDFEISIAEQDDYYDKLISYVEKPKEETPASASAEVIEIPESKEAYLAKLSELMTAYRARLEELKVEAAEAHKKSIAEKIAAAKASVGVTT